jgi:hypothetical protein
MREGANLDVIFPGKVSVGMWLRAVDSHSLPLSRWSRIIMIKHCRSFTVLHLDDVKRWDCDGSGFEPHQSREEGFQEVGEGANKTRNQNMGRGEKKGSR